MYNDEMCVAGESASVTGLTEKLNAVHAVLIATPEYNFSIPAV